MGIFDVISEFARREGQAEITKANWYTIAVSSEETVANLKKL